MPFWVVWAREGGICLEAQENYQKRSYRNRALIYSSRGAQLLSVPLVKGKNQRCPIRSARIAYDQNWVAQHIAMLQSSYGSAPYYAHYQEAIGNILRSSPSYLWDLNYDLIGYFGQQLGLGIPSLTAEYKLEAAQEDYRGRFSPNKLTQEDWSYPYYAQVFESKHGFLGGLSIVDLLFHLGPEAITYLHSVRKNDDI